MMRDSVKAERIIVAANQKEKQKEYWLNKLKLSGEFIKTCFPYDYKDVVSVKEGRDDESRFETVTFGFSGELFSRLMEISKGSPYTMNIILQAGLITLLGIYTGRNDIIIGNPTFKQDIEGDYINSVLVLRNRLEENLTVKNLLLQVRQTVIEAAENQDYPVEILAPQLGMPFSEADEFPLFDVSILVRGIHDKKYLEHINHNMMFLFIKTGEYVKGTVEYNTLRFAKRTVERIVIHFTQWLREALFNLDLTLSCIEILSQDERERILNDFNNTQSDFRQDMIINESFERQALKTPCKTAVVYKDRTLTYKEFNEKANRVARVLRGKGLEPGTIVGIMIEPSLEMMIAVFGVLKAGGACLPIDPGYPENRINYMLSHSGAKFLLASPGTRIKEESIELIDIFNLLSSSTSTSTCQVSSTSLAYIIYISGPGGESAGVIIEHRNVVNLIYGLNEKIYKNYSKGEKTLKLCLLSPFISASSLQHLLGAPLLGHTLCIVPPAEKTNGSRLTRFFKDNRIDISDGTPSHIRLLMENRAAGQWDFDVKHLVIGGDILPSEKVEAFFNRFEEYGKKPPKITNVYGMSEGSVGVTCCEVSVEAIKRCIDIPVGKPLPNQHVYIVDRKDRLQPIGVEGGLCIGGAGVVRGYLNRPELTLEKFNTNPFADGERIYRTGDRARWLSDGNIEFLGRIDHQAKIRGYRVEPGEIENRLLENEEIKEAAVTAGTDGIGNKYLCGYIVLRQEGAFDDTAAVTKELKTYLSRSLPDYMVPAYFVSLEKLPLTPNGKLDRKALPRPEIDISREYIGPRDHIEEKLVEIWSGMLDLQERKFGVNANFFELGGNSLNAVTLISRIHKEFNVRIPLTEIFNMPSIMDLSTFIKGAARERYAPIKPLEKKEHYALSSAQKRLYFLHMMDSQDIGYNMPRLISLGEEANMEKLEQTFIHLIERHESFRTSFHMIDETPVQKIHPEVEFEIQYFDLQSTPRSPQHLIKSLIRPFDLAQAPLLRVALIKTGTGEHLLMIDMHHIISDGTSRMILEQDFKALYEGEGKALPLLEIQYKDFSHWQNSAREKENLKQQEAYWLKEFGEEIPVLKLPTDYPRPAVQSFEGDVVVFEISADETAALKNIALAEGSTLFMVLLAVSAVLFSKLSSQEDIVIGTDIAGRRHADLENTMGMFVNTLALRNYPEAEKPFKEFLKEVKDRTLAAFENQDYQFEDLVDLVMINRDASRNPLFDVVFSLGNMDVMPNRREDDETDIPATASAARESFLSDTDNIFQISKFDLTLNAVEIGHTLLSSFQYCTKLFKKETINRFIDYYKKIISIIVTDPNIKIWKIEVLTGEEKRKLLVEFNDTETSYQSHKVIHRLFKEQTARTPDNIAAVDAFMQISYGELNEKSNRTAHLLRTKGVKADTIVGIMMEPSCEMLIGLLAILKAGGAYMPIDPATPSSRVTAMLQESAAPVLLTASNLLTRHSFTALQDQASTRIEPKLTPARERITHMDGLPLTDRSMIDFNKYNQYIGYAGVKHAISLEATRGCPYNCIYCHKIFPNKQVSRSAENILSEVQHYYNLGVRRFSIIDDIFNLNKKNSSRFFQLIIKKGLNKDLQLFFSAGLRGDILTKDYIDLMVEAGTVNVSPALETASPRLQKLIGKNLNIEKFRRNVEYFCEKYPQVITELFLMHGFPTETEEEARQTIEFVKRLKWVHFPYINILRIYSATRMAKLAVKHGISYESIIRSEDLAWHELPETLPFSKNFTLEIQTEFLNEYFLCKERLRHILPYQMKVMTEDELVQKYNSYLPTDIDSFSRLLEFTGIKPGELDSTGFLPEDHFAVPDLNEKLTTVSPRQAPPPPDALKVFLLDLNLYFSHDTNMLYDLLNEPLGLMSLMTRLHQEFGKRINGKIAKSRIDFNSYKELKAMLEQFKPDLIGIRTLTFYRDFIHKTISLMRQWGIDIPIIVGGPHVTTNYREVLQDQNIDLAVLGEGEITLVELMGKILENHGKLPGEKVLEKIPGLAFIPGKEKRQQQFAREIIMLDAADVNNGILSKQPGKTPVNINQPGDMAYVIFTSASTGKPKGVIAEHRNLSAYIHAFCREFEITSNDTVIQQASFAFDTFVEEVYPALLKGGKIVTLSKEDILDIHFLVESIQKNEASIISCSPLLLNELNKFGTIRPIRTFISGGDVLKGEYVDKLLKAGKVYNTYGPTETTVCVSYYRYTDTIEASIPIGKPISDYKVYILDRYDRLLPIGIPGELCAAGAGVTRGYLNNPELTAEKFDHDLWDFQDYHDEKKKENYQKFFGGSRGAILQKSPPGSRRLYKTGDLARWLADGNIEFLGRIDQQVKIRGYRIELGEIETCLLKQGEIQEVVVLPREDNNGDKYICAYIVSEREFIVPELRESLSKELPDYFIPSYFVPIEKIPLTSNGKIDKKALPEPIELREKYISPKSEVEKKLAAVMEKILGREKIGIDDNFFMIGGDSIKAIQIVSRMRRIGYKLETKHIFQNPTVSRLSPFVTPIKREIDQRAVTGKIPLTPVQRDFFEHSKIAPHHYNQAVMLDIREGIDKKALESIFKKIQDHHDVLRMSYQMKNGDILQIDNDVNFPVAIEEHDLKGENGKELIASIGNEIQAGIDINKGPLMKIGLFHLDDGDRVLIVIHHLVVDALSWRILLEDIDTLYRQYKQGNLLTLPLKTDSFKVWSEKLAEYADNETFLVEKSYWRALESQEVENIPRDFTEISENYVKDALNISFSISKEETGLLLGKVNEAFGTEINDILLTALGLGLKRTFGNETYVIALEGHGRQELFGDVDISRTVGWFSIVYPVLLDISYADDPERQIKEIKENLKRIPNKGIGHGLLKYLTSGRHKEDIQFKLNPSISFNYLGQFGTDVGDLSFEIAREPVGNTTSLSEKRIYDLGINAMVVDSQFHLNTKYNRNHYAGVTIEKLMENLKWEICGLIEYCSSREQRENEP